MLGVFISLYLIFALICSGNLINDKPSLEDLEFKIKISEKSHVLLTPFYLQITKSHFYLGEYSGTFIGQYELSSGELKQQWNLENLNHLNQIVENEGWQIKSVNSSPMISNIICQPDGDCFAAFFKDYEVRHEQQIASLPLAFMTPLTTENEAVSFVEHPHLEIWDSTHPEQWAGVDGGFYVWDDAVYVNNSETGADAQTKLVLRYTYKKDEVAFEDRLAVYAAESWASEEPYPYILLQFNSDGENLYVTDGRMIHNISDDRQVFSENHLEGKEIIMTYSFFKDNIVMMTGRKEESGFKYNIRTYNLNTGENHPPIPITFEERFYTYAMKGNTLYYVTKDEAVWLNKRTYEF